MLGTGGLLCPISGTSGGGSGECEDGVQARPSKGGVCWALVYLTPQTSGNWAAGPSLPGHCEQSHSEGRSARPAPPRGGRKRGRKDGFSLGCLLSPPAEKGCLTPFCPSPPSLSLPQHDLLGLMGVGSDLSQIIPKIELCRAHSTLSARLEQGELSWGPTGRSGEGASPTLKVSV